MLPLTDLFTLFISGGPVGMIIITLLFIALFFVAWKAPARGTTRLCKLFAWTFSLEKCYICGKFPTNITMQEKDGKYIFGVVKVGDKGQIVIPRDARKVYDIKPGDALLLLGDQRGMALVKTEIFQSAIDQVMEGLPK